VRPSVARSVLVAGAAVAAAVVGFSSPAARSAPAPETASRVLVAEFKNDVNPVTQDYLLGAIERGEQEGFAAVVIEMDTPGGLASSMRAIIRKELESEVAVVVFGISPLDAVTVIEGGRRVEGTDWDVTEFDDPRPWLPDWAIRLGGLLLVALVLEVLGLRARLGRVERDGSGGAAKGAGRENRGGPISA